jgi:hypothetical protein
LTEYPLIRYLPQRLSIQQWWDNSNLNPAVPLVSTSDTFYSFRSIAREVITGYHALGDLKRITRKMSGILNPRDFHPLCYNELLHCKPKDEDSLESLEEIHRKNMQYVRDVEVLEDDIEDVSINQDKKRRKISVPELKDPEYPDKNWNTIHAEFPPKPTPFSFGNLDFDGEVMPEPNMSDHVFARHSTPELKVQSPFRPMWERSSSMLCSLQHHAVTGAYVMSDKPKVVPIKSEIGSSFLKTQSQHMNTTDVDIFSAGRQTLSPSQEEEIRFDSDDEDLRPTSQKFGSSTVTTPQILKIHSESDIVYTDYDSRNGKKLLSVFMESMLQSTALSDEERTRLQKECDDLDREISDENVIRYEDISSDEDDEQEGDDEREGD